MSETILIIEDEPAIRSILSELLTDAGYTVETAGDGLEGITKFRETVIFPCSAGYYDAEDRRICSL